MPALADRSRPGIAVAVFAVVVLCSQTSLAARGDCAQPLSDGDGPGVTDCLFILQVVTGGAVCDPACPCAPKGTLPPTVTDALLCLQRAVGQQVSLSCPASCNGQTACPTGDWGLFATEEDEDCGEGLGRPVSFRVELSRNPDDTVSLVAPTPAQLGIDDFVMSISGDERSLDVTFNDAEDGGRTFYNGTLAIDAGCSEIVGDIGWGWWASGRQAGRPDCAGTDRWRLGDRVEPQ